jgi:hypothetical protein
VARMERNAIRDATPSFGIPDYAALHPGYGTTQVYEICFIGPRSIMSFGGGPGST